MVKDLAVPSLTFVSNGFDHKFSVLPVISGTRFNSPHGNQYIKPQLVKLTEPNVVILSESSTSPHDTVCEMSDFFGDNSTVSMTTYFNQIGLVNSTGSG